MGAVKRRMVETVTGPVPIAALGRTLMHEHLVVGAPGWEFDAGAGPSFREMVERCVDRIEELKGAGYASMVDPCPMDMGRDVELMREVAQRTGFNIICATGFYHGEIGAASHWRFRAMLDPDTPKRIAEILTREITEGVGETGIKAGILKTATGQAVTPYETMMLAATAQASLATGTPITTHTEGVHGDVQLDALCGAGVDPQDIIVGHTCGSHDPAYRRALAERDAYLGFDRFGFAPANTDENRADALVDLVRAGFGRRIVVSHDCVVCYRGVDHLRPERRDFMLFERTIAPMLRERGLTDEELDRLTIDNPRAFFEGRNGGAGSQSPA
jgi:phosphotriesterase-related protein